MARANKKPQLIEFKGTTLPVMSVTLHSLQTALLTKAASELFGDDPFFDGDAAVLELDHIDLSDPANGAEVVDRIALRQLFVKHGLNVIGVRDGSAELRQSAAAAGLPSFAAFKRNARSVEEAEPVVVLAPLRRHRTLPAPVPEAAAEPTPAPPVQPSFVPTLVIDRPLRSGQQAYARGGDLVVLAAVNCRRRSHRRRQHPYLRALAWAAHSPAPAVQAKRVSSPRASRLNSSRSPAFIARLNLASRTSWPASRRRSGYRARPTKHRAAS